MKKKNMNLFVLGAVILTLALFGCNSGKTADTTAAGALIDGVALYSSDCSGCHGSLATSGKRGVSVTQIQDAISHNWGGMGAFASLTADQIQAIATALSAPVTTTPETTTATDTPTSSSTSLDGAALYEANCSSCHGHLAASGKAGVLASAIQAAITGNYGGMGRFSNLTTAQLQAIADALSTVPAPAPVQTPTPASGTTSASPDGAALYTTYCNSCHGALATSSKRGATVARIQTGVTSVSAMRSLSNLTSAQIQAIAAALGAAPASTPSSTPSLAPAPGPAPTTVDGAALYTTYCSSCHGALASSSKLGATAPQIQTGISGNYGGMGQFSNLTTAQVQAIATALGSTPAPTPTPTPAPTDGAALYTTYCSSCHGSLAASSKAGRTTSQIQTAIGSVGSMNSLSSLTAMQIQSIATALAVAPTPGPTDGAALYTSYCSSCHGQLANSNKKNATVSQIQSGIGSVSQMRSISLTTTQIQAIAAALGTTLAPTTTTTTAPGTIDGAALYTQYCNGCHGSGKKGSSASSIQSAINNVSQMRSLSLTSAQIQAIATGGTVPAPTTTTTAAPGTIDGAALYTQYCNGCHGSGKKGSSASSIQSAINNVSQMRSLSLTSAQIQAIATGGTVPAPTTTTTAAPGTIDGAALYTQYCNGCHGSGKKGSSASSIQSAINNVSQMRSLSLTSAQIQAIATGGTVPAPTTTTTAAPGTIDGAALYTQYCSGCHGPLASSGHRGATVLQIQTGINTISGMMPLSTLTAEEIQAISTALGSTTATPTTTPTTFVCGSCHAIPPSTGHHSLHVNSEGVSCSTCHGTGYSKTTVNAATHQNGVVNIASGNTPGWNPATRSCSNSCHGTHSW